MKQALLKRLVPRTIKELLKNWRNDHRFASLVGKLRAGQSQPSRSVLMELRQTWNNSGFSADIDYLEAVCGSALNSRGPILECGSGLTSVLLGAIAHVPIYSLEHLNDWAERVNATLERYLLPNRVVRTPLIAYDGFDWYRLPEGIPSRFALVICDGPPGQTRGGRYGLLPVVGDRLRGATILLDDAERLEERDILKRWAEEFPVSYRFDQSGFARVEWTSDTDAQIHPRLR